MTSPEAAQQLLEETHAPLSAVELTRLMESRNLVTFRASSPRSIVLAALKSHSSNSHSCSPAKLKRFHETEDGRFALL